MRNPEQEQIQYSHPLALRLEESPKRLRRAKQLLEEIRHRTDNLQLDRAILKLESIISDKLLNIAPLVGMVLSIKGKPFSLDNHFVFEPLFNSFLSQRTLLKCARQTGKTTMLSARMVLMARFIPHFNILCVAPLFSMIRRISTKYVRPFIMESPVRHLLVDPYSTNNVLQRSFVNGSTIFFSYAYRDAERTRGFSVDAIFHDEVQDIDPSFIPIIDEAVSFSLWGLILDAGTPKTLSNYLEQQWIRSSQGEWVIPCSGCRYENVPALAYDLDEMIGPYRDDISEEKPGIVCAKCKRPVSPRNGFWMHAFPERRKTRAGYHVPQIIMPFHYAYPEKWARILEKRETLSPATFYNEVCAESYDLGTRLVTLTDLLQSACLWENRIEEAQKHLDEYRLVLLGIDWGGGGQEEISYTKYAVVGLHVHGSLDVLFGLSSNRPHDHVYEAKLAIEIATKLRCWGIAHDYGGAGFYREKYIVDAGWPVDRIFPVMYTVSPSAVMMRLKEPQNNEIRPYYQLDKPRSLLLLCHEIKNRRVRFFKMVRNAEMPDPSQSLLEDFLSLVEEKRETSSGLTSYSIIRGSDGSDDFAQAVNIAACCCWYSLQQWPRAAADISRQNMIQIREQVPRNSEYTEF